MYTKNCEQMYWKAYGAELRLLNIHAINNSYYMMQKSLMPIKIEYFPQ